MSERGGLHGAQVTQEMPGKGWGPSDCFREARWFNTGHQKKWSLSLAELG